MKADDTSFGDGGGMSLARKSWIVVLVYLIEGFPMGVYADVWPVYFRREGMSLAEIGLLSSLSVAWSAKVLWSPLVDRFGERQHWIAGALIAMAGSLAALAALPGASLTPALWLVLATFCVASATQDIAIDAYTIGLTDRGDEGPVNSLRVAAYRVGLIAAGGGLLFLPRWVGWPSTFGLAAAFCAVLALSLHWTPRVPVPIESRTQLSAAMHRWVSRPRAWQVVSFVALYRIGDRAMGPMIKPFWVDFGFADEEIALISTTAGALATVLGAILGGVFVKRYGIANGLWTLGLLALLSNLSYAAAATIADAASLSTSARVGIYAASIVESFCGGLATAAFLSFLMRICEKEFAAVQYASVTAIYALAGSLIAIPSGWLVERLDYGPYFALTAAFALPAFAFWWGARAWILDEHDSRSGVH